MGRRWLADYPVLRESIAEGFGTFILMVFGQGSVAHFVIGGGTGSFDMITWAWGLGVMFGVFTAGGISGGHINPAVTLSMCVVKKCPWRKLLPYWAGQYLGSFLASCVTFIVYYDAIKYFDGDALTLKTAGIFATYPQEYLSAWNGLADQVVATSILVFLINAMTDPDNMAPSKGYLPVVIGLIVTGIGISFGLNSGYAINPARDFAPRLFTLIAGWDEKVFKVNDCNYFWIPVVGPYIGGVLGGLIYIVFLQMKNPFENEQPHQVETADKTGIETNNAEAKYDVRDQSLALSIPANQNNAEATPM